MPTFASARFRMSKGRIWSYACRAGFALLAGFFLVQGQYKPEISAEILSTIIVGLPQDGTKLNDYYCASGITRKCSDCVATAGVGYSKCTGTAKYTPCLYDQGASCVAFPIDCTSCTSYSDSLCTLNPQALSQMRWQCVPP